MTTQTVKGRKQLLVEVFSIRFDDLNEAMKTDIKELPDGRYQVRCKGQHCGVRNRNGRMYEADITWGPHTLPRSPFQRRVYSRRVIGQLEHPKDGRSEMPLGAIVVTKVEAPDEDGIVYVTFETMSTPLGKIAAAYIKDRVGFGISSRGEGTVIRNREGVDVVQADYQPSTFDLVLDESTPGAEIEAVSEARRGVNRIRHFLMESAHGDIAKAAAMAAAETVAALRRDLGSLGSVEAAPPTSGATEFLLSLPDGSGEYRAFTDSSNQWEVFILPSNLPPRKIAGPLPTIRDAKLAAENHLRLVVGDGAKNEGASRVGGTTTMPPAKTNEDYSVADKAPFGGVVLYLNFDNDGEAKGALSALEKAGFHANQEGSKLCVHTAYDNGEMALGHVQRILTDKKFQMRESVGYAVKAGGKIVWADDAAKKLAEGSFQLPEFDYPVTEDEADEADECGEEDDGDGEEMPPAFDMSADDYDDVSQKAKYLQSAGVDKLAAIHNAIKLAKKHGHGMPEMESPMYEALVDTLSEELENGALAEGTGYPSPTPLDDPEDLDLDLDHEKAPKIDLNYAESFETEDKTGYFLPEDVLAEALSTIDEAFDSSINVLAEGMIDDLAYLIVEREAFEGLPAGSSCFWYDADGEVLVEEYDADGDLIEGVLGKIMKAGKKFVKNAAKKVVGAAKKVTHHAKVLVNPAYARVSMRAKQGQGTIGKAAVAKTSADAAAAKTTKYGQLRKKVAAARTAVRKNVGVKPVGKPSKSPQFNADGSDKTSMVRHGAKKSLVAKKPKDAAAPAAKTTKVAAKPLPTPAPAAPAAAKRVRKAKVKAAESIVRTQAVPRNEGGITQFGFDMDNQIVEITEFDADGNMVEGKMNSDDKSAIHHHALLRGFRAALASHYHHNAGTKDKAHREAHNLAHAHMQVAYKALKHDLIQKHKMKKSKPQDKDRAACLKNCRAKCAPAKNESADDFENLICENCDFFDACPMIGGTAGLMLPVAEAAKKKDDEPKSKDKSGDEKKDDKKAESVVAEKKSKDMDKDEKDDKKDKKKDESTDELKKKLEVALAENKQLAALATALGEKIDRKVVESVKPASAPSTNVSSTTTPDAPVGALPTEGSAPISAGVKESLETGLGDTMSRAASYRRRQAELNESRFAQLGE